MGADQVKAMIHQPNYLPWRGWFEKARKADVLVLLDTVAFTKGGFTNRTRIRSEAARGWSWLTVPVRQFHGQRILGVQIDGDAWRRKHVAALEQAYGSSPLWPWLGGTVIRATVEARYSWLADLNTMLLREVLEALGICVYTVNASELDAQGAGTALLADICRRVGADTYLAGGGAPSYLSYQIMADAGIEVEDATYATEADPPLSVLDDYFRGEWA